MNIEFSELIKSGKAAFKLNVLDPTITGVKASLSTIGTSIDQKQWVKVGSSDNEWSKFLTTENGGKFLSTNTFTSLSELTKYISNNDLVGQVVSIPSGEDIGVYFIDEDKNINKLDKQHTHSHSVSDISDLNKFVKDTKRKISNSVTSKDVKNILRLTQAQYDKLDKPNSSTLYIITG